MEGYIKLYRSLLNWEWWDDANTTRLWIYTLCAASFRDSQWHGQSIHPGQLVTSYSSLALKTNLSVRNVRTSLNRLKSTGELTIKTTRQFSLITINNWDKFQGFDAKVTSETTDNLTNDRQASDKQTANKRQHRKNDNKDKNEENETINEISNGDLEVFFESIWKPYPRKEGKGAVSKTQKTKLYHIGFDELSRAIDRYKAKLKADGTQFKFIKQGSTFFNSGYVDYLDANFEPQEEQAPPKPKPPKGHIETVINEDGEERKVWVSDG